MNISGVVKTSRNLFNSAANFVRKNPLTTVGIAGGAGLIGYAAVKATPKQNRDIMNQMLLANPYLNPIGFSTAMFRSTPNELDSFLVKAMIEKNNNAFQSYYA